MQQTGKVLWQTRRTAFHQEFIRPQGVRVEQGLRVTGQPMLLTLPNPPGVVCPIRSWLQVYQQGSSS